MIALDCVLVWAVTGMGIDEIEPSISDRGVDKNEWSDGVDDEMEGDFWCRDGMYSAEWLRSISGTASMIIDFSEVACFSTALSAISTGFG